VLWTQAQAEATSQVLPLALPGGTREYDATFELKPTLDYDCPTRYRHFGATDFEATLDSLESSFENAGFNVGSRLASSDFGTPAYGQNYAGSDVLGARASDRSFDVFVHFGRRDQARWAASAGVDQPLVFTLSFVQRCAAP
jgi:hypothetical protein